MKVIGNSLAIFCLLIALSACERQHADHSGTTSAITTEPATVATPVVANGQDISDPPEIRSQNGQLILLLEANTNLLLHSKSIDF